MALKPYRSPVARPAIFLDKDGTVLEDVPYNAEPSRMRWAPGAEPGIRALAALGRPLVVVSNQAGIAFGRFGLEAVQPMVRRLADMFRQAGGALAGFYYCPHHPEGRIAPFGKACGCRKPAPGLLLQAARELRLDLSASWMVGDILDDVEAGHRAGCRSVLLDVGHETEWVPGPARTPEWRVQNLEELACRLNALHQQDIRKGPVRRATWFSCGAPSQRPRRAAGTTFL